MIRALLIAACVIAALVVAEHRDRARDAAYLRAQARLAAAADSTERAACPRLLRLAATHTDTLFVAATHPVCAP